MARLKAYIVEIPIPPSANHRLVWARNRAFKTAKTLAWESEAGYAIKMARIPNYPPKTKVLVQSVIRWPDARRRDCDNTFKCVNDLLQSFGVVPDDSWIIPQVLDFEQSSKKPGITLIIRQKD